MKSLGRAEGEAKGRAEGEKIGQIQAKKLFVKKLLAKKMPVQSIAEITELSLGEVQDIEREL
jgi:predicted transposase/invertase (TIGR01784 family)